MASVVDTSVKHFLSTMVGAPTLSGTAGAMIAVLDACLINGFDVKAATSLVVASGVATLSFAGSHSATLESVVLVSGVTDLTALNGEQRVTAAGAGFVKFATAAADGTATGTVSFKMAPAGWEKPFSGANLAVYRSLDVTGTRMYVRVDDTGTVSARLRGYETMSDVNTGAGLFPTDAQISGGGYLDKSSVANSTAVKWRIIADGRGLFLSIVGYSSTTSSAEAGRTVPIGDFTGVRPGGDPYSFVLGSGTSGGYNQSNGTCDLAPAKFLYVPRAYHGLGGSIGHVSVAESGGTTTSGMDTFFGPFPSKIDGSMRLSRRTISDNTNTEPRGILPGIYTVSQSEVGASIAPGTVIPGTGPLAGRKLLAVGTGAGTIPYPSTSLGITMFDITGPWAR